MWKLYNKLFGWDYIGWSNAADVGIARVFIDGNGRVCYFRYKGINVIDTISYPMQVIWLTCSPSKYLGE